MKTAEGREEPIYYMIYFVINLFAYIKIFLGRCVHACYPPSLSPPSPHFPLPPPPPSPFIFQVHHLENTGSALAEDVIQKSEIIKSYFMDNKAGLCLMYTWDVRHSACFQ